jgi:siroheme synthase-like protein
MRTGTLRRPGPVYFPLGIHMAGLECLVFGGGRVGTRKALALAAAGARVQVVSPQISDALRDAVAAGRIGWAPARYDPAWLRPVALAVAATSSAALNDRIARHAEARGILCCQVSSGARSRVIFPAVLVHGDAMVAVHTHGRDCRRSQRLRDGIRDWLLDEEGGPKG